jgi:hypothetical protein
VAATAIMTTKYMALLNEPEGVSGKGVTGNVATCVMRRRYAKPSPTIKLANMGIK